MPGSRVCPYCGKLNSSDERRCVGCGQALPGPVQSALQAAFFSVLGREYPLTRFYIGFCVLVYVAMSLGTEGPLDLMGADPVQAIRFGAVGSPLGLGPAEPWRYLSATFVHFGVLHIAFNLVALYDFGKVLEQRIGSARFVLVLIGTAVLGFVASDVWQGFSGALTAGASGGLFGLAGALVGVLLAAKDPAWKRFLTHIAILAVLLAVAFESGAVTGGRTVSLNHAAHVAGFIAGFPTGYLIRRGNRPSKRSVGLALGAGAVVLLSVASVALSAASPVWRTLALLRDA